MVDNIYLGNAYNASNFNQLDELPSTFEEVQLTEEEEKYFVNNFKKNKARYKKQENFLEK